jgi:hypothetical protein
MFTYEGTAEGGERQDSEQSPGDAAAAGYDRDGSQYQEKHGDGSPDLPRDHNCPASLRVVGFATPNRVELGAGRSPNGKIPPWYLGARAATPHLTPMRRYYLFDRHAPHLTIYSVAVAVRAGGC